MKKVHPMRKNRYIITFILCWVTSAATMYFLNIIWPTGNDDSTKGLIARTFIMSIIIIIVLNVGQNKDRRRPIQEDDLEE